MNKRDVLDAYSGLITHQEYKHKNKNFYIQLIFCPIYLIVCSIIVTLNWPSFISHLKHWSITQNATLIYFVLLLFLPLLSVT
jgi:hypothetical protein